MVLYQIIIWGVILWVLSQTKQVGKCAYPPFRLSHVLIRQRLSHVLIRLCLSHVLIRLCLSVLTKKVPRPTEGVVLFYLWVTVTRRSLVAYGAVSCCPA